MVKYLNPMHKMDDPYFSVEDVKELKKYFDYMAPLWASGLDKPSIADRMAFIIFKNSFGEVENA